MDLVTALLNLACTKIPLVSYTRENKKTKDTCGKNKKYSTLKHTYLNSGALLRSIIVFFLWRLTNETGKTHLFNLFTLKFIRVTCWPTTVCASLLLPKNYQRKKLSDATLNKSRKTTHKVAGTLWHISLLQIHTFCLLRNLEVFCSHCSLIN